MNRLHLLVNNIQDQQGLAKNASAYWRIISLHAELGHRPCFLDWGHPATLLVCCSPCHQTNTESHAFWGLDLYNTANASWQTNQNSSQPCVQRLSGRTFSASQAGWGTRWRKRTMIHHVWCEGCLSGLAVQIEHCKQCKQVRILHVSSMSWSLETNQPRFAIEAHRESWPQLFPSIASKILKERKMRSMSCVTGFTV